METTIADCPVPDSRGDYPEKWGHIEYSHVVRYADQFAVVVDKAGHLDWETSRSYDDDFKQRPEEERRTYNDLLGDIAVAESYPCEGFSNDVKLHFKRLLGEATVFCLEYEFAIAKKVLASARQYIQSRSEETSRRWYLAASAKTAAAFVLIGIALWLFRAKSEPSLGPTAFWLALACSAGALGALFSVIARSGELKLDACSGETLHTLEGFSRVIVGAISALVVAMAVRADIIFGAFADGKHLNLVTLLAALAAGTGERLATSIISKFDETHASRDSDASTNQPTNENEK